MSRLLNQWQCRGEQCPVRAPVSASSPPKCYTCGQRMSEYVPPTVKLEFPDFGSEEPTLDIPMFEVPDFSLGDDD